MRNDWDAKSAADELTKRQRDFLVRIGESWVYEESHPTISKALMKKGLLRIFRSPGHVCASEKGREVAKIIVQAASQKAGDSI